MSRSKLGRSVVDACADCGALGKIKLSLLTFVACQLSIGVQQVGHRLLGSNLVSFLTIVDQTWASINKGILICDECCSIHRTLGRNVSYVNSLRKGTWVPTQLAVSPVIYSSFGFC